MHYEILIEDLSGKKMLDILLPKLLTKEHTYKVIPYRGVGHIARNLNREVDPSKRHLLNQLPRLLQGYGKTFQHYSHDCPACVVVVVDLDNRDQQAFLAELQTVLNSCHPQPQVRFCFAIEEGEAWFLGDQTALLIAYPRAKKDALRTYQQDSICGTWEVLAEAVYPGGATALKNRGWQAVGAEKSRWSECIAPHMQPERNQSPSFQAFAGSVADLQCADDGA